MMRDGRYFAGKARLEAVSKRPIGMRICHWPLRGRGAGFGSKSNQLKAASRMHGIPMSDGKRGLGFDMGGRALHSLEGRMSVERVGTVLSM